MRINRFIAAAAIAAFFYLTGCEKQVHRMDIDPVKERLVLNGSLGPDQKFKLHISSSMEPVGPELADLVEDAEISVTDENYIAIYPRHDSMGFYIADWYPEEARTYTIRVRAMGFEDVYADVSIPEKLTEISLSGDSSNTTYPYTIRFHDRQEKENTYMIRSWYQYKEIRNLWTSNNEWIHDTIIERRTAVLISDDEMIRYSADGTHIGDSEMREGVKSATGFLISDELFNGKEHVTRFKPSYVNMVDPDRPYLYVEVISLNREFYNFVKSYCLYFEARQAPFAEPVAILSNIVNGLGFIYGYSVAADSILMRD